MLKPQRDHVGDLGVDRIILMGILKVIGLKGTRMVPGREKWRDVVDTERNSLFHKTRGKLLTGCDSVNVEGLSAWRRFGKTARRGRACLSIRKVSVCLLL